MPDPVVSFRRFGRALRLVALGVAVTAPPAAADQLITPFDVLGWEGGAYQGDDGRFSRCLLKSPYAPGVEVGLSSSPGRFTVNIYQDSWRLPVPLSQKVFARIDRRWEGWLQLDSLSLTVASLDFSGNQRAIEALRAGRKLSVEAPPPVNSFSLTLQGTMKAIERLRECSSRYMGTAGSRSPIEEALASPQDDTAAPAAPGGSDAPVPPSVYRHVVLYHVFTRALGGGQCDYDFLADGDLSGFSEAEVTLSYAPPAGTGAQDRVGTELKLGTGTTDRSILSAPCGIHDLRIESARARQGDGWAPIDVSLERFESQLVR